MLNSIKVSTFPKKVVIFSMNMSEYIFIRIYDRNINRVESGTRRQYKLRYIYPVGGRSWYLLPDGVFYLNYEKQRMV